MIPLPKVIRDFLSYSPKEIFLRIRNKKIAKKNQSVQKAGIAAYFLKAGEKNLHIGCGDNILPGWLNTDFNPRKGVIFLDARDKFPFRPESFDYIFSEHLVEHLKPMEQGEFLEECLRVLKPGGICRIATPDMQFLVDFYNEPQSPRFKRYAHWAMGQTASLRELNREIEQDPTKYAYIINSFFRSWGHEMIHNEESITHLALRSGFKEARRCEVGESTVEQLRSMERHQEIISAEMNEIETMVVELIK